MRDKDSRLLSAEAQQEMRLRVVELRVAGKSNLEISEATGVNRTHVSTIWQRYLSGGTEALEPRRRGRKHGEGRSLIPSQEDAIREMLLERTPKKLGLKGALWTRETVRQAIQKEFGVEVGLRTMTDYLQRWGITPPKPAASDRAGLPMDSRWWLDTTYPRLAAKAKEEGAEIFWFSDNAVRSPVSDNVILPETATEAANGYTDSICILSAVNNRGKSRFMLCEGALTAQLFVRFLSRLARDNGRKVLLIMCVQPLSPRKVITTWLLRHRERLELAYMPPNSPLLPRGTEPYID